MIQPLISITRRHAVLFAVYLVLYEFLVYIANDMIMPGMLSVVRDFHASESHVATSLTAYILGGASLQLLLGPLSDRFGRRPVMLIGSLLFTVLTLCLPFAQNIDQFLLIRFFEGMGLCYIGVVGYALLQEIFSDEDALRLIAVMANVAILAPLLGPLAGSIFLQYGGNWHAIFYLIGSLSLFSFWGLWCYMPESVGQIKRDGTTIKRVSMSLSVILKNYQTLIKHPVFLFGTFAYGVLGVPCLVWIALSPIILVSKAHMTLIMYGIWQIPVFGAFILGTILLRYWSRLFEPRKIAILSSIIVVLGLSVMTFLPYLYQFKPWTLMPGLVVYSFGYGIATASLYRFILFVIPIGTGTASAVISMISMSCLGVGVELGNTLFAIDANRSIAQYMGGVMLAYLVCAYMCFFSRSRKNE
jgi:DHA1 family multidrug/chloramphenicol efflux transport protein-like MFS transporter